MRRNSTTLLFRDATAIELVNTLQRLGARRKVVDGWIWSFPDTTAVLEAFVIHDAHDWEIDLTFEPFSAWWMPLKEALGSEPTTAMIITWDACQSAEERRVALVRELLAAHRGIAGEDEHPGE